MIINQFTIGKFIIKIKYCHEEQNQKKQSIGLYCKRFCK